MNLQPVKPYRGLMPIVSCCKCGTVTREAIADLDGVPFQSYYCPPCAKALDSLATYVAAMPQEPQL